MVNVLRPGSRFVRFVSTPEILERVSIVSTELSQIEEDANVQANESSQVCLTWTFQNWEWFQFRNSDSFLFRNYSTNFLCHDILAMIHVQADISGVRNSPATPPSGTHVIHILLL